MKYYCNPVNLEYKYQFHALHKSDAGYRLFREAADPSVIRFENQYYMFVSMCGGVYRSDDLLTWRYQELPETLPLYGYAPDARVVDGAICLCASDAVRSGCLYKLDKDLKPVTEGTEVGFPVWDPNVFQDEDGRVYLYWGSSCTEPIYGIELDAKTLQPVGERQELIHADITNNGYERFGEDHVSPDGSHKAMPPYLEGAWMTKHDGKYYLQYAGPGTEFNIYGDGVYVSQSPLGPFERAENNPYSYAPGGFMRGAGHGSTFQDTAKNWWHTSTMQISCMDNYERRIGLWRAGFDEDGELYCNQRYGDWPTPLDAEADRWANPPWMLLSFQKRVAASSEVEGKEADRVTDENCQTWWQADSTEVQKLDLDLGREMEVHAVQINFADDCVRQAKEDWIFDQTGNDIRYIDRDAHAAKWYLEGSTEGKSYFKIEDKSEPQYDAAHDFLVYEQGMKLRYLRLTILEMPYEQPACVSGFRVFGLAAGAKPEQAQFTTEQTSQLDLVVRMKSRGASGYNIVWGHAPDKLYHSFLTYEREQHIGAFVKGTDYYMRVDSFNESGITEGMVQKVIDGNSL